MEKLKNIKAIAFDADDTLWALQNYFEDVEHEYCELLAEYGKEKDISAALFETESKNMADLGYGCKAFTISLVENAVKVSHGKVEANVIAQIVDLGKSLLHLDAKPLEGVEKTLACFREMKKYKLAVFTKGELMDQENKLWRSGLQRYFDVVTIVSDKTPKAYHRLCRELDVTPDELVMVGNSFKSDIAPALKIEASTVHIPFHTTWAHEKTEEFEHPKLRRISRFEELLKINGYKISGRILWLINPHYMQKFKLRPRKLNKSLSQIRYLRNFFCTSCFYITNIIPKDVEKN